MISNSKGSDETNPLKRSFKMKIFKFGIALIKKIPYNELFTVLTVKR